MKRMHIGEVLGLWCLQLADRAFKGGRYEVAQLLYTICAKFSSYYSQCLFGKARCYFKKGQYQIAESVLRKLLQVNQSAGVYFEMGRALAYQHHYDQAEDAYVCAIKLDPSRKIFVEGLFRLLLIRGLAQKVIDYSNILPAFENLRFDVAPLISQAYCQLSLFDDCAKFIAEWSHLKGNSLYLENERARLSLHAKREFLSESISVDQLEEKFMQAYELKLFYLAYSLMSRIGLRDESSLIKCAQIHLEIGNKEEALDYYKRAKGLSISRLNALEVARLGFRLEQVEDCIEILRSLPRADLSDEGSLLLARAYRRRGYISRAITQIKEQSRVARKRVESQNLLQLLEGDSKVFIDGLSVEPTASIQQSAEARLDVLHVLETALPHRKSGYAYRTRNIFKTQREKGLRIAAITRPGFPWDLEFPAVIEVPVNELVEGVSITHIPLNGDPNYNKRPLHIYLEEYVQAVTQEVRALRPALLHAHSNFKNAYACLKVSKMAGIPFVYEVRGFWEDTLVSKGILDPDSQLYRGFRTCETFCMKAASAIVTLSESMREEIISRGVDTEKVFLVPNGVDVADFAYQEKREDLARAIGLKRDEVVVGYVGSFFEYEGIDLLVQAFARLQQNGFAVRLLLVGDGEVFPKIKKKCEDLNLGESAILTGRMAHDIVASYYSLIDIFVIPRRADRVCNLVTPIKPIEAMACRKTLVVSDLKALKEIVGQNRGVCFEAGNWEALYTALAHLVPNSSLREQIAQDAYNWVMHHRKWSDVVEGYQEAYAYAKAQ